MVSKDTLFHSNHSLKIRGKLLDLKDPKVMGILNITPDSFYIPDGHQLMDDDKVDLDRTLKVAEQMIKEDVDVIDVGGVSARPGAKTIDEEAELSRVIGAIEQIAETFPDVVLSVDTFRGRVAKEAVNAGAHIVNDISGGSLDHVLIDTVASLDVPYVLMHMQGTPETMQDEPSYDNVVEEVMDFFLHKVEQLRAFGIKDIIIDPGFGFGKTVSHNYELLKKLDYFKALDLPILVGVSRKSMICKPLEIDPKDALNGTSALHAIALLKGANILRAHDVKEAKEVITLMQNYHDAAF